MENMENPLVNGTSVIELPKEETSSYSWHLRVPLIESFHQPRAPLQISQRIRFGTGVLSQVRHYWILTVDISKVGLTLVLPSESSESRFSADSLSVEFMEKGEAKSTFPHPLNCLRNIMSQNEDFIESELLLNHSLWAENIDCIRFTWIVAARFGRISLHEVKEAEESSTNDESRNNDRHDQNDSQENPFNFADLLFSETLADISIECADETFHAHRAILSGKSPVFAAMFSHYMRENQEKVLKIEDIRSDVMKEVLCFIYTSKVDNLEDTCIDLMAAAEKYQILDLKQVCENRLIRKLTCDNAVQMFGIGDLYRAKKLQDNAVKVLKSSKLTLYKNRTQLKELNQEYPDLVFALIFQSNLQ